MQVEVGIIVGVQSGKGADCGFDVWAFQVCDQARGVFQIDITIGVDDGSGDTKVLLIAGSNSSM